MAAAIGAKIDISKPAGHLVLDIGGGTADIAVLSLNGIVQKESIKLGGDKFDQAVVRYLRERYGLLIGEKMAELVKPGNRYGCAGTGNGFVRGKRPQPDYRPA